MGSPAAGGMISPFGHQTLSELFPKDQYGKDMGSVFHHIVIHAKDTRAALVAWEKKVSEKYPADYYSQAKSSMQLTPLHVSAMKGNQVAVEFFINHGAPLEAQDLRGWTPLHHAAARGDKKMLEQMIRGRDPSLPEIKNKWGATPQDFIQMQRYPEIADDKVVCQIQEEGSARD